MTCGGGYFDDLGGKTAVITGGAGVLCTAFAEALAGVGVNLALLDINADKVKTAAQAIAAKYDVKILGLGCDVLCEKDLVAAHEMISEELGPCEILVNGAGGNAPKATTEVEQLRGLDEIGQSFFNLKLDAFKQTLDLNFIGTMLPTQKLSRDMVEKKRGVIVNISSMNAVKPLTRIPAYSAAKSAVSNFTEWLAVHLAPVGIRVNAIAPGFILTEQLKYLAYDERGKLTPRYEKVLSKTAMGRLGEPCELQGTLLYLVSNMSSFVTGAVIPVDGGFSAGSGV